MERDSNSASNSVSLTEVVVEIACGALHSLIRTDKNNLYSCGFGETYALGNGDSSTITYFK